MPTIDLAKTQSLPDNDPLLDDIQCNILSPHRRKHSVHLFVRLPPKLSDLRWYVASWAHRVTPARQTVVEQTARFAELQEWAQKQGLSVELLRKNTASTGQKMWLAGGRSGLTPPPAERGLVKSFLLTANALSPARLDRLKAVPMPGEREFGGGGYLTEPSFEPVLGWEAPFDGSEIEAQILLAADSEAELVAAQKKELEALTDLKGELLGERAGYVAKNSAGQAIEHFGYADGLSNPLCLASEIAAAGVEQHYSSTYPLENFLFELPEMPDSYGSFQVFRQIEQHVATFKKIAAADRDELVGRQPDGTSLAAARGATLNDFVYPSGTKAGGCPFHAHVRKANPREPKPEDRRPIFPRRGMLYGARVTDAQTGEFLDQPEHNVGLLFMGYMGSVATQFAFMNKHWVMNPEFPKNGGKPGFDRLLSPYGQPLPRVTTVKGGEYFFVPPISWLSTV